MNALIAVIHKFIGRRSEKEHSSPNPLASMKMVTPAELSRLFSLFNSGQLLEMENVARSLVEQYPDSGDCWKGLSVALQVQGKNAISAMQKAADLLPDDTQVHNNLGGALRDAGQLDRALASFRRAIELDPESAVAYCNTGIVMRELGNLDGAIGNYRRAILIKPDYAEAYFKIGDAQGDIGQLDRAVTSYRRALDIRPDFAQAYNHLSDALRKLGRLDSAMAMSRRALDIIPDFAEATNNLGAALLDAHRLDDALANFRRALVINPALTSGHCNAGLALRDLGKIEDAIITCRRAVQVDPGFTVGRWNLSLLLLSQGRYTEAWPFYESRNDPQQRKSHIAPVLPYAQWRGEALHSKSLLLWPEQGYGDYIQFVRFARLLKDRGVSRLTLFCAAPLAALLETVDGVDAVVTDAAAIPLHDYWSFPMSIPLHVGTTLENIPITLPYLRASPQRIALWKHRLPASTITSGFKVGIVWKGSSLHHNDAQRSLPRLDALMPLWGIPGITFVSLQRGHEEDGTDDAASLSADMPLIALGAGIKDFADAAAIIAQLDLVICVDTAIAHLAGAMGKPCWVLLPALGTDWRWLHDRSDSPWYPGVLRLFRQSTPGDWGDTIQSVALALQEWCGT